MAEPETPSIEITQRIEAPRQIVWAYLVDPKRMSQWVLGVVEADASPGRGYRIRMREGPVAGGEFLQVEPPSRVVMSFGWEGNPGLPPGSTRLEITLTPDGQNATLLQLRHFGLPNEQARQEHTAGWTVRTASLAQAVLVPNG